MSSSYSSDSSGSISKTEETEENKDTEQNEDMKETREKMADFESYLIDILDKSIKKKKEVVQIKQLNFESWWMESGKQNKITLTYKLGPGKHVVKIQDTKYYLEELYIADNAKSKRPCEIWDLFVGAKVDIFGKATILKTCCLKTCEWNKFYGAFLNEIKKTLLDEIKKYE